MCIFFFFIKIGQVTNITQEIINEVLANVFPKKDILDKVSSTIYYNRTIDLKSKFKPTSIPIRPDTLDFRKVYFKEGIRCTTERIPTFIYNRPIKPIVKPKYNISSSSTGQFLNFKKKNLIDTRIYHKEKNIWS